MGLFGFPNAESHLLYNELPQGGPVRMPRLDENGPCIARRRRGVVSEQTRLQAGTYLWMILCTSMPRNVYKPNDLLAS